MNDVDDLDEIGQIWMFSKPKQRLTQSGLMSPTLGSTIRSRGESESSLTIT